MRVRPKLILTFSVIFVIAFAASSLIAHSAIESALKRTELSNDQATSILAEIGASIGIASGAIGIVAVLVVFWVSSRIANPISNLSGKLKNQRLDQKLRNIEISRNRIDQDDEINEVIYTINSMINRLNELEEKKDTFLSMISHELKIPASVIIGFTKALLKPEMTGDLTPQQKKSIETIRRNATRLENLIGDLLDSRKIQLNKMKFSYAEVDITKLLEYIHTSNSNILEDKHIEFVDTTSGQISATTDGSRLDQVLTNFVRNAVDFVPEKGGRIEIGGKTKDNEILFYVQDNGSGVSEEKQKELFKKSPLDKTIRRTHGGAGLGLPLCKGIINAMGGKLWVESEPDKGSIFYFEIPKTSKNGERIN
jgi:signal transduction histidine kinase